MHPASLFEGKHKRPVSGADLFGGLKNNFVSAIVLITGKEGQASQKISDIPNRKETQYEREQPSGYGGHPEYH